MPIGNNSFYHSSDKEGGFKKFSLANRNVYILPISYYCMKEERKTFYERLEESNKQPKEKISVSVNKRDLVELKKLMAKHFPDVNLSQAFNEMLIDALEELKNLEEEEK